jgi:hypothetical protein
MDAVTAAGYGVSMRVAYAALAMLAANRYVSHPRGLKSYRVTWDAGHGHTQRLPRSRHHRGDPGNLPVDQPGRLPSLTEPALG